MTCPLLQVDRLTVGFGSDAARSLAVSELSFCVGAGETLAIVGESGSGKSVTALSIMRLIEREGGVVAGGRILFSEDGLTQNNLASASEPEMRRIRGDRIAMIFQEPMTSLNPVLSIGAQLAEVLVLHRGASWAEALTQARQILDRVRIPDAARRLTQFPHELSGGMRQRVMIAMALLCRPRLLIADEPTTALDVTVQAQIIALLDELRRETGMSVLFISHDLGVVSQIADRIVVMRAGELKEEAATKELFSNPKHAYTQELLRAAPRLGAGILLDRPPADQPPVMSVKGLTKRFAIKQGWLRKTVANVHAVENVSFELFPGETLAIVGESGCGKSTLGRTLARLIQPDDGSIILNGVDVTHLSRAALQPLRRNIQMVFQDPYASLNPRLTVCDAITEPLIVHEPQMSREQRRKRAVDLLLRVGLAAEMVDRFPHQFSGGQRQRLCIARALCLGPKIIIADEAVSALDVSVQAQVLELMKQLQQDMGIAFIFISHDMAVVEKVSHRVAVMYLGQIVEIGPTRDVLTNPQHPYTRKLLASVPQTDFERPRSFASLEVSEVPSPLRPLGARIEHPPFIMAGPEHSFQAN